MVAPCAFCVLSSGLAAKFTTPNDQSFVEQATLFEILQKTRDRFIGIARVIAVVLHEITMSIPIGVVVVTTAINLNEAHAPFHKSAGEQTFLTKIIGALFTNAVQGLHVWFFLIEIHCLRRTHLHFVS